MWKIIFLESDINEFIYKTNRLTDIDIENKLRVTKGKWKEKNK